MQIIKKINARVLTGLIIVSGLFFVAFFYYLNILNAAPFDDIKFPISELNNCFSKEDCAAYCDNDVNFEKCVLYGEKNNLISKEEAEKARKLGGKPGPGGCRSLESCEFYCDNINNIEECLNFARKNNVLDKEEIEEAEKVLSALKKGVNLPGGCGNKKECDAYCENSNNMEECLLFAEEAGFMEKQEIEMARKIGNKKGPGGCMGRKCKDYCENPEHFEECLEFAEENGLIKKEDAELARKTGGKGPGDCKGRKECESYCEDESHLDECLAFAEEHNLISKEEAEMAKITKGKGPGGCTGKEECETFCNEPQNMEECISFAEKHGFISKEEAEKARKFGGKSGPGGCAGKQCESYCEDKSHREECFKFAEENGLIEKEELENMKKGMEILKEKKGPGGCASREECEVFCENPDNFEKCLSFAEDSGMMDKEELEYMKDEMDFMKEMKEMSEEDFNGNDFEDFGNEEEYKINDFQEQRGENFNNKNLMKKDIERIKEMEAKRIEEEIRREMMPKDIGDFLNEQEEFFEEEDSFPQETEQFEEELPFFEGENFYQEIPEEDKPSSRNRGAPFLGLVADIIFKILNIRPAE